MSTRNCNVYPVQKKLWSFAEESFTDTCGKNCNVQLQPYTMQLATLLHYGVTLHIYAHIMDFVRPTGFCLYVCVSIIRDCVVGMELRPNGKNT